MSFFDENPTAKFFGMQLGFGPLLKFKKEKPGFINRFLNKRFGERGRFTSVP